MEFLLLAFSGLAVVVPLFLLVVWLLPILWRPLQHVTVRTLYRFSIYHRDRIPARGGVLLLPNHITYLDWLFLLVASPRPLKFVIWSGFYRHPALRFLLSFGRKWTIRLERGPGKIHAAGDALKRIAASLDAGEVIVLFAEQHLSRNGQMHPFSRGVEAILSRCRTLPTVMPVFLDNLWGSVFGWSGGRILKKWPELPLRRRVAVYFGRPLPATSTAAELREAVIEASAECGIAQSDHFRPSPSAFVRQACRMRHLFSVGIVDMATGTERKLTWSRALVAAWSLRSWLKPRLGAEQNVGIWMPTSLGSVLCNVALNFLGRTTVNLNYTSGQQAVEFAVRQAGVNQIVTSRRFCDKMPLNVPDGVEVIHLEDAMSGMSKRAMLLRLIAVILLPGWFLDRVVLKLGRLKLDATQTILFSSGSTAEPKGVMLNYRNIASNVDGFRRGVEFLDTDRMLVTLPFFHCFGYTVSLWSTLTVGMEAVIFPDPRQAKEIGELCRKHACTILLGTATFLRFYLKRAEPDDFKSLRLIICGAEKLPVKLAEEFHKKFGVYPYEGYGCTELSPVVGTNLPDVTVGGCTQQANRPGTVGRPIPNVCIKTFCPETHALLPHGVEGLLGCLGANVMQGYLNQPEKSAEVLHGGWYVSGDVGRLEDGGFVRITGRVSRFAKIAGEMIPLERLDEQLHEQLGGGGERKLAVAAVPCEKRGERIVVLHLADVTDDLPELFRLLKASGLPNLWIPDLRDCRVVDHFPVMSTGKLDLKRLGESARELIAAPLPKAVSA